LDKFIDFYLEINNSNDFSFDIVLPLITKLHFEKVDKKFEKFGEKWGNYVISSYPRLNNLELNTFSGFLLKNVSFFNEKLFPNINLQGIENPLQVVALLEGKYFRYLSNKKFLRDLNFKFE
jgi:hypothetical protein